MNLKNSKGITVKVSVSFILILLCFGVCMPNPETPVRIGYFHGSRTKILFRAYIDKYFEDEGVNVELYSKYFKKEEFYKVPQSQKEMVEKRSVDDSESPYFNFGTARGTEIVEAIDKGVLDGGCIGESSFISKIATGSPIMAVAMLGYDDKNEPAKAIVMRKDVVINKPEDFKGKVLASRRAGPGDALFLREFIKSIGLDPEKDLTIIEQVPYHEQIKLIRNKKLDGFLGHLCEFASLVESGECYVYQKMDWINSSTPHALLVFRNDFLKSHPREIKKIIRAYMKRIKFEQNIPEETKVKEKRDGLQMAFYFQGMSMPKYKYPPFVSCGLLKQIQESLFEYKIIEEKVELSSFINNDFVKGLYEELK